MSIVISIALPEMDPDTQHRNLARDSCLMLIDLQNSFIALTAERFASILTTTPLLVNDTTRLIQKFRSEGLPIILIRSSYPSVPIPSKPFIPNNLSIFPNPPPNDNYRSSTHVNPPIASSKPSICRAGTPGFQFPNWLKCLIDPLADTVITKTYYSAFTDTDLLQVLQAKNIKNIYIAGVTANTCVLATATDACLQGYKVSVLPECVSSVRQESKDAALEQIRRHYGQIVALDSISPSQEKDSNTGEDTDWILYYVNGSIPSWRVMMYFGIHGIKYDKRRLKVMTVPKETRSEAFHAINPRCQTPVLINTKSQAVLYESLAILAYLQQDLEKEDTVGNKPEITCRVQESENIHNVFEDIELLFLDDWEALGHKGRIGACYERTMEELDVWDGYLENSGFISSTEQFTTADCAFYPCIAYMMHRGLKLDKWPRLKRYMAMIEQIPGVKEAVPEGWNKRGRDLFGQWQSILAKEELKDPPT